MRDSTLPVVCWLLMIMFLVPAAALAHRVNVYGYAEAGKIFTDSFFPDGKRCKNSKISVFDSEDNLLLEGRTNDKGEFSFDIPKKGSLRIVLDAGLGHRAEHVIPAEETADVKVEAGTPPLVICEQKRLCVGNVIGGIGYIVGIMGIVMYMKSRKDAKG